MSKMLQGRIDGFEEAIQILLKNSCSRSSLAAKYYNGNCNTLRVAAAILNAQAEMDCACPDKFNVKNLVYGSKVPIGKLRKLAESPEKCVRNSELLIKLFTEMDNRKHRVRLTEATFFKKWLKKQGDELHNRFYLDYQSELDRLNGLL